MIEGNYASLSPWDSFSEEITSVVIEKGVSSIGSYAFYDCSALTSVNISNSVTSIGAKAFEGCDSLASIAIPNSVTTIGGNAFAACSSLRLVEIPYAVTTIGQGAFDSCTSLSSLSLPLSVSHIGDSAFSGCYALSSIYYEGSESQWEAILIGTDNYALTKATTHFTVTEELTEGSCGDRLQYSFAEGVLRISGTGDMSDWMYYSSVPWYHYRHEITAVVVESGVTSLGQYAFSDCKNLSSIALPTSLHTIEDLAFENCHSLSSITIPILSNALEFPPFRTVAASPPSPFLILSQPLDKVRSIIAPV